MEKLPKVDYAKLSFDFQRHHERFCKFVEKRKLTCMECGGAGGSQEVILDDGTGPWDSCGYCEGTGYMSPHMRGQWLKWKREEKRASKNLISSFGT